MAQDKEEAVFTVGQLAAMLGCSIRSIYRWEEKGVIPEALRVERGEVSARIYTQSQVDEIRKKVQNRISFTAVLEEGARRRRTSNPERRVVVVHSKKNIRRRSAEIDSGQPPEERRVKFFRRSSLLNKVHLMDPTQAPLFVKAIKAANREGCEELMVKTASGKILTFVK